MKYGMLFLVLIFSLGAQATSEKGEKQCNPVVVLDAGSTTLQKALTQLANQHNFKLVFPVSVDKNIESPGEMSLSKMLHYLTADLNAIVQTGDFAGCETKRVTGIEILPVGEKTEYVYVEQQPDVVLPKKNSSNKEYIIIDDMNVYAEEVLLKKRKAMRKKMSAEQKESFKTAKRVAKKRLVEQGLLDPKRKKSKEKKQK